MFEQSTTTDTQYTGIYCIYPHSVCIVNNYNIIREIKKTAVHTCTVQDAFILEILLPASGSFVNYLPAKKNGAVNRILGPLGLDQAHAAASTVIL